MTWKKLKKEKEEKPIIYGGPEYSAEEDIYSKVEKVELRQLGNDEGGKGETLDIPGSELDDDNEEIGEEDEENNYYSLGGDEHNDLEDDPA